MRRFLAILALAIAFPAPKVFAGIVLSDGFNANSGGVPAAWTHIGADLAGTVIESGTTVTLTDGVGGGGSTFLKSNATFNPLPIPASTLTVTLDMADMSGQPGAQVGAALFLGDLDNYALAIQIGPQPQTIAAYLFGTHEQMHPFALPAGPQIPSYAGGALELTLTADADSFRLTTDVDGFDSGDLTFASAGVPGFFSLYDLGPNVGAVLVVGAEGHDGEFVSASFDNISIDVSPTAVPEAGAWLLLGAIGGLVYVFRRSKQRSVEGA